MQFIFSPSIQNGIASGAYEVVRNSAGIAIGIARDKVTGRFVAHAIEVVAFPFLGIPQLILGGFNLLGEATLGVEIHRGFQKTYQMIGGIQNSLGVLQATTPLLGVASIAGVALSAVNLHQTLKLKKEVQELKYEVKDGFIKVLEKVRGIPDEVQFRNHRTILIMAYGEFLQATKLMKLALSTNNNQARHSTFSNAQLHLSNAHNAYNQSELFEATTAPAQLRRLECGWMIEQTQAVNFQLMNAPEAASDCLKDLQQQMQSKSLEIIDNCNSEEELEFLYPEITRIHRQDVPILNTWENQLEWMRQLSSSEKLEIANLQAKTISDEELPNYQDNLVEEIPEILEYRKLESQSHYESMRNQLRYIVKPDLRQQHLNYIKEQATSSSLTGLQLDPFYWNEVSDLAIANLYNYLKIKEK